MNDFAKLHRIIPKCKAIKQFSDINDLAGYFVKFAVLSFQPPLKS